jgi:hypothetical protein
MSDTKSGDPKPAGPMPETAAAISTLPPEAAKLVAIEILLADPESLADDILESCLYILREKLRTG